MPYEVVVYPGAKFFLEEGWWTIQELESLLETVKREKAAQDERLKISMEILCTQKKI